MDKENLENELKKMQIGNRKKVGKGWEKESFLGGRKREKTGSVKKCENYVERNARIKIGIGIK